MAEQRSSFSYAVFRYVKDPRRDLSVPVGVAVWSEDAPWVGIRFAKRSEKVQGINRTSDFPFVDLVARKIDSWVKSQELPYSKRPLKPFSDHWGRQVREVLVHKVKLSEPLPIDCTSPEKELELLFRDVVRGLLPSDESKGRVDHLVAKCLGREIMKQFERGPVEGYAGKPVKVMRQYVGSHATVVVEGVNLAVENAADAADALVGRLRRVRDDGVTPRRDLPRQVLAVVGYVSTPEGLNGEAYLRDWIEKAGEAPAFDVERQGQQLRDAALEALDRAGPRPALFQKRL